MISISAGSDDCFVNTHFSNRAKLARNKDERARIKFVFS